MGEAHGKQPRLSQGHFRSHRARGVLTPAFSGPLQNLIVYVYVYNKAYNVAPIVVCSAPEIPSAIKPWRGGWSRPGTDVGTTWGRKGAEQRPWKGGSVSGEVGGVRVACPRASGRSQQIARCGAEKGANRGWGAGNEGLGGRGRSQKGLAGGGGILPPRPLRTLWGHYGKQHGEHYGNIMRSCETLAIFSHNVWGRFVCMQGGSVLIM